ncbi:MAG: hypothetical protein IJ538_02735 [Clostridia bacterium]|nr:hypothetical protein [Clostridia bacterium]
MIVVIASDNERKLVEELGFKNAKIIVTGMGGINVIQTLKNLPKNEEIVNIGYAGSNSIPVGTKVEVGISTLLHEFFQYDEEPIKTKSYPVSKTICYTSTDFVTKTNITEPCVFDMELAYICAMFNNVKSIKVVSDNLNLHAYEQCVEEK